jgi:hypothetical protein
MPKWRNLGHKTQRAKPLFYQVKIRYNPAYGRSYGREKIRSEIVLPFPAPPAASDLRKAIAEVKLAYKFLAIDDLRKQFPEVYSFGKSLCSAISKISFAPRMESRNPGCRLVKDFIERPLTDRLRHKLPDTPSKRTLKDGLSPDSVTGSHTSTRKRGPFVQCRRHVVLDSGCVVHESLALSECSLPYTQTLPEIKI